MDPLRTRILKLVDAAGLLTRSVGQIFGFLSDERERVQVSQLDDCTEVRFADLSDEGWPGFALRLPKSVVLFFTTSSVLTRSAEFRSPAPVEDLVAELAAAGIELPSGNVASKLRLEHDVSLTVAIGTEGSLLTVSQRRDPDSIKTSLKERVRRGARAAR